MDNPPLTPENNPRLEKIDKSVFLSRCQLFTNLSQWEIKSISRLMRLIEYKKDELVYREGERGENFYVIVSGRFEVSVSQEHKKKVLAYLRQGDYFGEMSLLTDEPHSATLRAISDSLVLVLKKEDFKHTVEHNARVSLEMSRRLTSRVTGHTQNRLLLKSDVISIFSQQQQVGRTSFSINLAASLFHETHQKSILVDMSPTGLDISSKLHIQKKIPLTHLQNMETQPAEALSDFLVKHPEGFDVLNLAHEENDSVGENLIIPLLNYLAVDYRFILIDLPRFMDEMVLKALGQSDKIFLVTDSHVNNLTETTELMGDIEKDIAVPEDRISVVIHEALLGVRTHASAKRDFFGKKISYSLPPTPALKDLGDSPSSLVMSDPDTEYSRVVRHIARRISNNLVGIALGSGAALGLAHIGVLKVLERERIPIDMVSGSSIGALIGALYATTKNAESVEKVALEINSPLRLSRLLDFNLFPIRGLLSGKLITKHFKSRLAQKNFEDCLLPLKIIGANLTTRQIQVFESGNLADAVRVSIAIPAIIKPLFFKGEIMVDGGILSPLPIRVLQQSGANKIIAVNVFPSAKDVLERNFLFEEEARKEEIRIKQKNFLARGIYGLKKQLIKIFFPNVFDVLMNTIQSMETAISEIEGESADLLIRPVVSNANWVEFFKPEMFIKRGEEEAEKMLPKIKALVSQQNI